MKVHHSFSRRTGQKIDATNKHSKTFPKIAQEVIDNSDVILEILDARFVFETRNKEFEDAIKKTGKRLVYVLNKSDLIDAKKLKKDLSAIDLYPYVLVSSKTRRGASDLRNRIKIEARSVDLSKPRGKGVYTPIGNKIHVGVIGYPNTGKSSVINMLTGKSSAYTSQQSGFTKGAKKIKLSDEILLIDSPGVIPLGENSAINLQDLKKHGMISVITWDKIKDPDMVVHSLMEKNPDLFEKFYNVNAKGDSELLIEELGRKRNMVKKKGEIDIDRVARIILRDWQEGKIK